MKETRFLIKLLKEGRIEFVEPSEEIGESYINKSESYLESSRILIK
ncbi:DNA-binding protein, partial [Candidatus Pacearchaeota archaeon CG10_big_fil_rev_8_21_14_0_10_35_13]